MLYIIDDDTHGGDPKDQEVVITNLGLPSAKTLRGGTKIIAKGRHGTSRQGVTTESSTVPHSAVSNYSRLDSSSRYKSLFF